MSDLRDLYQEVILDHGKRPRNFRFPDGANRESEGFNPLCGDRIELRAVVEDGVIRDIGFQGEGCAISQAAASTMTEAIKGKSLADFTSLFSTYHALVTGSEEVEPDFDRLGKLAVFAGVAEFPMRVKCATLAWHTLQEALAGRGDVVSTEE
jgi:nitrogen fixation protein NifU and related proteins